MLTGKHPFPALTSRQIAATSNAVWEERLGELRAELSGSGLDAGSNGGETIPEMVSPRCCDFVLSLLRPGKDARLTALEGKHVCVCLWGWVVVVVVVVVVVEMS
jgi:hypothetical protein